MHPIISELRNGPEAHAIPGDVRMGRAIVPRFMDVHHAIPGLTGEAVAGAHQKDLEVQGKHGVNSLQYWYDEGTGNVFCLV